MTDFNTDDIRKAMVETGQPQADLAAITNPEHTCTGPINGTNDCLACNPLTTETWDTEAMRRDFEPLGFAAPFIIVRRRSDGVTGSLEFTHSPRVYFNWVAD